MARCSRLDKAQSKKKTLMSCNTHISSIISFKRTPSARSVIDSIKAVVLKVLLAYNTEKTVRENRAMRSHDPRPVRDYLHFINAVCKQWSYENSALRSKRKTYPDNKWAMKKSFCCSHVSKWRSNGKRFPKNNGDKVMNRSSTFVTVLNVQKSQAGKVSFCGSQIVPFRKANSIANSKHTLPSLINTSRTINHGDFLRFFHKTTNFMLARQWLITTVFSPRGYRYAITLRPLTFTAEIISGVISFHFMVFYLYNYMSDTFISPQLLNVSIRYIMRSIDKNIWSLPSLPRLGVFESIMRNGALRYS